MINNWKKFLAVFLCVSMIANVLSFVGEVKAVENKWTKYTGNTSFTNGSVTEDATGVTLETTAATSRAAAYYTEKVTVQEGTKISMDVEFPEVVSTANLQYAFGITTDANSFYTQSGTKKNTVVTEFTSLGTGTNVMANGSIIKSGSTSRTTLVPNAEITTKKADITTTKYNVTLEKQAETSENSWIITVKESKDGGKTLTMSIAKTSIAHDVFANGAYIIAGTLNGTLNTAKVSNVTITQSTPDNPDTQTIEWVKYTGNPTGYTGTFATSDAKVTLNAKAAAYVKEKVTVQEGTKIAMDVKIPTVVDSGLVQYAFGLASAANTFHNADATAIGTTLVTELVSLGTATTMTAGGAIRLPGASRVPNVPAPVTLTNGRTNISTTTYNITFEKQATTSDNSWVITAKEDKTNGTVVTMNIPKDKISHEAYADGAYIIAGAMCGTANTLEVSNVTVTQPGDEPINPDQPDNPNPPVNPDEPTTKWTKYTGNPNGYTGTVSEDETGVTMTGKAAGYVTEKVTIQEGTKISMDVEIPTVVSGQNLQYAFGITTGANSFHNADATSVTTTLVTELVSLGTADTMTAGGAIRLPGANRVPNVPTPVTLTNGRANISTTKYNITFEKQATTSNNSWVITAKEDKTGGNTVTMNVPKDKIAHDVYADGAYIIAGSMSSAATTMKVTSITVTQSGDGPINPDQPDNPEYPNAIWTKYTGNPNGYTGTVSEGETGLTMAGKAAAYVTEKVTVQEGTKISMDVEIPTVVSGQNLQYAFGITTGANSFHNADTTATTTTLVTELVSLGTADTMTAGGAIRLPGANRVPNVPVPVTLTNGRANISTTKYNITFEKQESTSDYSWVITAKEDKEGGKVVAMRIPKDKIGHDVYANGAYIIAGSMNGVANTIKVSNVTVGKAVKTAWEAVRGYDGADFTTSTNEAVTLIGGKGGAYRREAFKLENNSYISLQYEAKALTKNNSNDFYIMWLDKPSLVNGAGDAGNGYALQMRTSGDYSSFTLFLREVSKGKMGTDNTDASLKIGGGTINASALNQKIEVKFTRRTQTLDGAQYYGFVTVTVAGKSYTKQITMEDAKRVFGDLDKDLYLMAGNMNNIVNTFEVKNVKIAPISFIESIDGLWKRIIGYSKETLGAIVNRGRSVDLYGQGAAYLSQATNGSMNLSFNMTELTNDYHNKFSFAILNKSGSFVNDGTSSADGFTVEFRSFDQFEKGYAVYVATVTNGKATNYEKLNDCIVLGDLSKAQFDISLVRNSNGSWDIKVVDKTYSKTLSYTLKNNDALKALTPGNIHLSAGNAGIDMKATIGY